MTTTPMNLRLAMAAWSVTHDEDDDWDDAPAIEKHPYMLEVDAILAELEQPSAADEHVSRHAKGPEMLQDLDPEEILQIRRWWIEHVRNESQD